MYKSGVGRHFQQISVIEARLAKARYLLLGEGVSVEFVARECGFSSPFYFSRLFKAKTGVAPRDYYRQKMALL